MTTLVFDAEADGFLYPATQVWCITTMDADTGELVHYDPSSIINGLKELMDADMIVGHNCIGYDLALFKKLYPWFKYDLKKVHDTFIMSSLFEPDREGGHSVEQYAKEFGGEQKVQNEDWSQYTENMKERNISDTRIQMKIWQKLKKELTAWDWSKALALEYRIAEVHAQQVLAGVQFDIDKAYELADEIALKIQDIDVKLNRELPMRVIRGGVVDKPFKLDGTLSKRVEDWYGC